MNFTKNFFEDNLPIPLIKKEIIKKFNKSRKKEIDEFGQNIYTSEGIFFKKDHYEKLFIGFNKDKKNLHIKTHNFLISSQLVSLQITVGFTSP